MKVLDPEMVKIKFIYLKKDPVKVVRSFQKKDLEQPSKGLIAANFYYFLVNSLCILTVWLLKKKRYEVVSIKYGNLLADPLATLTKIETALAVNLQAAKEKIVGGKHLDTGFLFDGNRIRLSKTLKLRKENSSNSTNFGSLFTRVFNYVIYR